MAVELPEHVANLSEVGERLQGFYEKDPDEGGFKLGDPDVLKRAHKSSQRERREALEEKQRLEAELKKFEGFDPDEYERLKSTKDTSGKPGDTAEFNAWKADAEANWTKKEAAYKDENKTLRTLLEREAVEAPLYAALQEAGATKEGMKALPDLLRPQVKIEIKDGSLNRQVVRPDGTLRYNDENEPMSLLDLAKGSSGDFPSLFTGEKKTGPGGGGSAPVKMEGAFAGKTLKTMSPADKVAYQKRYGMDAFAKLAASEAKQATTANTV
jgi:hypothetical protein